MKFGIKDNYFLDRSSHSLIHFNDFIYMIGGYNNENE